MTPCGVSAQISDKSDPAISRLEQIQRNILNELHLLRTELLRMSVNSNRSHLLIARIRLERERIDYLTREIGKIHDSLDEIRVQQQQKRSAIKEMERLTNVGMKPKEELTKISNEMVELEKREQTLVEMEQQFAAELEMSKNNVANINRRLDEIEQEMAKIADAAVATKSPQ